MVVVILTHWWSCSARGGFELTRWWSCPACGGFELTILMNGALSRIPWRVRYLARGTIDRLKNLWGIARIVPQITGKETLCSCFQAETSKENVLVRLLCCCSHLQEPRDICGLFYVHFQTSPCLTHYTSIMQLSMLRPPPPPPVRG